MSLYPLTENMPSKEQRLAISSPHASSWKEGWLVWITLSVFVTLTAALKPRWDARFWQVGSEQLHAGPHSKARKPPSSPESLLPVWKKQNGISSEVEQA